MFLTNEEAEIMGLMLDSFGPGRERRLLTDHELVTYYELTKLYDTGINVGKTPGTWLYLDEIEKLREYVPNP